MVIDDSRLLTCLHVIAGDSAREQVWVAFPKAVGSIHRDRRPAVVSKADHDLDVAVLRLAEDLPSGVAAPPLRCPPARAPLDKRWWAFGFADSRRGNSAYGSVAEGLGDGYIRIDTNPAATYRLRAGFSGGGVWSPDFGAVVGVVVTADEHGNGEAITLHQIDLRFPEEKLGELTRWTAGQAGTALAAWGWTLGHDPEGVRHWGPKGRGVSGDSERGFRFRGRREALTAITGWLDREHADRRALVVTGSPGAGKSAVLGRVVTTADPVAAAALPASDQAVRATPGSVACAVHVKGKTALEVATEIARAASASLPDTEEDFAPALRTALAGRGGRRFNLIVDALDETTDPEQARTIITKVILPLVETCADVGAQVITGSRHSVGEIDLLAAFGDSVHQLDLDDPALFRDGDLAAYAMATLQLEGGERDGNPYSDEIIAWPVAARIAALSDRNFLVAGLIARAHGLHDQQAADPAMLTFTASVDAAMRQYLQRLAPIGDVPANTALTALAFAEAPGLPLELWQAAVQALDAGNLTGQQLARFARSPAASFLIESSTDSDIAVFRLFHQALNDALLRAREQIAVPADDQAALTRAFTAAGEHQGWDHASSYLLRSLPAHAAAAGMIDTLLVDDAYLLHADLRRLIPLADHATSQPGRQRSRLLRLTPRAIPADPPTRTALFSVTETLDHLGRSYTTSSFPAPYRAVWATAMPLMERSLLEGHTEWVRVLCPFDLAGRTLLASGGGDGAVRIWDPVTGTQQAVLEGHARSVISVCPLTLADRTLLASGDDGGAVRIWDPATGSQHAVLEGRSGPVSALCAFTLAGRTLLASGDDGRCGSGIRPSAPSTRSWKAAPARLVPCAPSLWLDVRCWLAVAVTGRCGSGIRPPAPSTRSWKATPAQLMPYAPLSRPDKSCWLVVAVTVRCGYGIRPPAPSTRSWKATPAGSAPCVPSPWAGVHCWPAVAVTVWCGYGIPSPALSTRSCEATPVGSAPCVSSPRMGVPCWLVVAMTVRCGSGILPSMPAMRSWMATPDQLFPCAPSPWPTVLCWRVVATMVRCGFGILPPAPGMRCWRATPAQFMP